MDADSDLLLSLYRAAMSRPTDEFQDYAIRLIRPRLRFASAIWGAGYFSDAGMHPALVPIATRTLEIDPEAIGYWKTINRADKIIPIVRNGPWTTFNFHAPTLFAGKEDRVMRDYACRFGRQSYLCTALSTKASTVFEWCSLYRPDPDDHFTESERKDCQRLMEHLCEALRINRLTHHTQVTVPETEGEADGVDALATCAGELLSAQEGFLTMCRRQWTDFDGRRLPSGVTLQLVGSGCGKYRTRHFVLHARPIADLLWLRADAPERDAALAPRRMDAAALFAQGYTYKGIAKMLGVAPATVRNQLASCYRELGVSSRAELKAKLEHLASAPRQ
ncbi:MAG TPA: LuxR C-terminal-related transcriptional regulator [Albitalea sp.]|uniref:helix-turn-helix transcriptional regulator n=1 Tax=Piscinibacter sp. TaxID=1903157 RepID=UPI002ED17AC6